MEDDPEPLEFEHLHRELARSASGIEWRSGYSSSSYHTPHSRTNTKRLLRGASPEQTTAVLALNFYHQLRRMLDFLDRAQAIKEVQSFVLIRNNLDAGTTLNELKEGWRHLGATLFWRQLFSVIDPSRVVVVAPPRDLAFLINTVITTRNDWAFGDMNLHMLELRKETPSPLSIEQQPRTHRSPERQSKAYPAYARSSVLCFQPWTHLALNEGSFLRAYGTYEFFERGPPSVVHTINELLAHYGSTITENAENHTSARPPSLPFVRSFTYTAIFPFANHARFHEMLPFLEELDCQFAPDPDSGILDDKDRVGKAELEDCWQELFTAYVHICDELRTSVGMYPGLKKFVCADSRITGIREELEHLFTPLCLPLWAETKPGVFHKLIDSSASAT